MFRYNFPSKAFRLGIILCILSLPAAFPARNPAATDPIAELHEKAKKEGGKLTLYAPSARAMNVIPAAFMKRFPGVTVDHIDATPDKLLARIVSEARGGRVLADVFGGSLDYVAQLSEQQLVPLALPEAGAYAAQMKSDFWVATDTQFYITGWNTNLVKKGEEPKNFEDLANSKWKDSLMGEPRDFQLLIGFAERKYNSLDKAVDLFKKIAANQVQFHTGHSQLIEFLVAGQRAVCFTCYSHHFPPRMKKARPFSRC